MLPIPSYSYAFIVNIENSNIVISNKKTKKLEKINLTSSNIQQITKYQNQCILQQCNQIEK